MEEEVAKELFKRFAKPGEILDDDWIEAIEETIVEEGELVATQAWNSGGPGIGAGVTSIYRYRSLFFTSTDFGVGGPYNGFREAAEDVQLFAITDATESIWVDYKVDTNSGTSDDDGEVDGTQDRRMN
jgi:hypothetical protein